ncbi:hypothetical protein ACFXCZ_34980 [Streptomyces sp. NPDC059396]|uniref:hypothetical protein n=1 Tax=Streptomyces sp. NPDC059396 TaxID=3346819 RepID=UPI00367A060C
MPRPLTSHVVQDPGDGFRLLPHLETEPPGLRISCDVPGGGRVRARMTVRMTGTSVPALMGTVH